MHSYKILNFSFWWENDVTRLTAKFHFQLIAKEIDDFERPFQLKQIKTVRAVLY